jgi:hypothetical protein
LQERGIRTGIHLFVAGEEIALADSRRVCSLNATGIFMLLDTTTAATAYQCLDCKGAKPGLFSFNGGCKRCDGAGHIYGTHLIGHLAPPTSTYPLPLFSYA